MPKVRLNAKGPCPDEPSLERQVGIKRAVSLPLEQQAGVKRAQASLL